VIRYASTRTALLLLLFAALPNEMALAQTRIVDGDTFEIAGQRIRLFGIDAPENRDKGGSESARELKRLIGNSNPVCERIENDRYGRVVGYCIIRGADIALAMVRAGQAVAWCYYLKRKRPQLLDAYKRAEAEARESKKGIWKSPFQPWREWGC